MKKFSAGFFSFLILFTVFVEGCQNDPSNTIAQRNPATEDSNLLFPPNNDIVLLKMPRALNGGGRDISVRKLVTPDSAAVFQGTMAYTSESGKQVFVDVKYKIPAEAVSDTVTVTMRLDTVHVGVRFEPSGLQFAIPSTIDVTIENLDPFSQGSVAFVYVRPNGTLEPILFENISVTGKLGKIKLKNGLIRHFSQYSFGRLTAEENGR